ncbi:MAG: hypothetical protein V3V01_00755 [Acidimicrobiales bacterium]
MNKDDRLVPDTVNYTFDTGQGIWRVECGDTHFFSTGLLRAKAHARAVFGAELRPENMVVDPTIDGFISKVRNSEGNRRRDSLAALVDYVYVTETPIGVHDLCELLDCSKSELSALFSARGS